MMGLPNDVSVAGVYVPRGLLKVTLPLLFTYRLLYVLLKKSMGNGRSTRPVEPSSLAGRVFVLKPARMAWDAASGDVPRARGRGSRAGARRLTRWRPSASGFVPTLSRRRPDRYQGRG